MTAVDRSRPPSPGPQRSFDFPAFERSVAASGLTIITCRRTTSPLVYAELVFPAGADAESPQRAGLATLTAALLDEGTESRSSTEIAAAAEDLGGFLGSSAGWNAAYLTFGCLSEHFSTLMVSAAEIAAGANFPQREFDRLTAERAGELARRRSDPAAVARKALAAAVYSEGTYSTPLLGTEETLERLDRDAVAGFHAARYQPDGSALVVVGDVEHAAVEAMVTESFSEWQGAATRRIELTPPAPLGERSVTIVDRPGAAQTELRLGHVGISRAHPDQAPVVVMNSILGGKFTSRLNLNLRERHGYTYGVNSSFARRRGAGPFVIQAAVATENAGDAVRETLSEIDHLREVLVEEDELADTIQYLIGVFPYTLQTNDGLAQRLIDLEVHDLPDDHFSRYLEQIAAVDRETIQRSAREHLTPEAMAIVAVGPAATLAPQLEDFGPLTVESDSAGNG